LPLRKLTGPLRDQQVLVRNLFMSVDPYMRGRMNDRKSYVPPFELGEPLDGGAVGEVIESRAREIQAWRRRHVPVLAGGNTLSLRRMTCILSAVKFSRFRFTSGRSA
jgi:hypothetical protein